MKWGKFLINTQTVDDLFRIRYMEALMENK